MSKGLWNAFKWCVSRTLRDSFKVSKTETLDCTCYECCRVDYVIKISTLGLFSHNFDILVRFLTRKFNKAVEENR